MLFFKRKLCLAAVLLTFLGFMPQAHSLELSPLGVMTLSNGNFNPSTNLTSSMGVSFGAGATLGFDLMPFFVVETGALFLAHKTAVSISGVDSSVIDNSVMIPALLRFNPFSLLSLGAGLYYGVVTSTAVSGGPVPALVSTAGERGNDFGLLGAVGIRYPLGALTSLRFDVLYEFGLVNVSKGTTQQNMRNIDVLAGIQFELL